MEDDILSASSLILADVLEKVPTKSIGTGPFVDRRVEGAPAHWRRRSTRNEKLGIYMQLYNFEADEKTHKPDGTIDYEIVKVGATKDAAAQKVFDYQRSGEGSARREPRRW